MVQVVVVVVVVVVIVVVIVIVIVARVVAIVTIMMIIVREKTKRTLVHNESVGNPFHGFASPTSFNLSFA